MNRKISKLLIFIIFLGIMWILPTKVKANTLTISASNTTLTLGQTTTITVTTMVTTQMSTTTTRCLN